MEPVIICAIEATTAEAVVLTAAELAPALGARVLLLHVENDPALFTSSGDRDGEPDDASTSGEPLLRSVGALLPYGTRVEERVALGAPAGEIISVAEDVGASLIVVGSRRRGPLAGSVSEHVVRRASCPVVIAPVTVAVTAGRSR